MYKETSLTPIFANWPKPKIRPVFRQFALQFTFIILFALSVSTYICGVMHKEGLKYGKVAENV